MDLVATAPFFIRTIRKCRWTGG